MPVWGIALIAIECIGFGMSFVGMVAGWAFFNNTEPVINLVIIFLLSVLWFPYFIYALIQYWIDDLIQYWIIEADEK